MVTIIDAVQRKGKDGKPFMALILQGGVEMVQSQTTGKFFATAKKCSIASTFEEKEAKAMIGCQINGIIGRVECEPYDYTVKATGEVITLAHTYEYIPEDITHQIHNQRSVEA